MARHSSPGQASAAGGWRGALDPLQAHEQGPQPGEPVGVGAVGKRARRVLVDLHEEADTPAATPAGPSVSMKCESPPERSPSPPGRCTLWVTSNTTGKPNDRSTGNERMSTTRLL